MEQLKALCELHGVSGREEAVRSYIIERIKDKAEVKVDALGSIIAKVKGRKRAVKKVMADAHMDEVGFIVTYITSGGMLKFTAVGGISESVMLARRVVFSNGIVGVISSKPVHMLSADEKSKLPDEEALYIDIGAKSFEEASKKVGLGDCAVFDEPYEQLGDLVISKALDDRVGCWGLIDIINSYPEYDFYAVFSVMEEIGHGARTAAFAVDPDYAVVLESTTAADIAGVPEDKKVCHVGKGATVSFMDRGTLYDKILFDKTLEVAESKSIPCQVKSYVSGGNNAAGIHQTGDGVKTITLSVPCRYIHSASCVASVSDVKAVRDLAEAMIMKMASGELE